MQIFVGADHRGFELKRQIVDWLREQGHEVSDVGPEALDPADDYPDFAFLVGEKVASTPDSKGIAICGSGAGMAIAANKIAGVRAALMHDPELASHAKQDDDVNVLALGADYISATDARKVITAWLNASFAGEERHTRRLQKIANAEYKETS